MERTTLAPGDPLVIASHNQGKIVEIWDLLAPYGLVLHSSLDLGLDDMEETGASFEENATLKAQAGARQSGMAALGDDCGLSIAALRGAPGLETARWARQHGGWSASMKVLHELLVGLPRPHTARFTCALALALPDGTLLTATGSVSGTLIWPPRGEEGGGYDPIFLLDGQEETFGEMELPRRNNLHHRARALEQLAPRVFQDLSSPS